MNEKRKILVCGDVEGKFNTLFKRVATINEKSGPFDLLLCVGNFFGINNKEFDAYKLGEKKVPIQTYILGPNSADHVEFYPDDESVELCPNVSYLGKRGLFTDNKGLKIAYLSGVEGTESNDYEYSSQDVTEVYNSCLGGNPSFRGIDILLTSQWPNGVINNDSKKINLTVDHTSNMPSWLAMKLKPRYHISGLEGIFYERSPYRAPNLGDLDTTLDLVTRFLGLARVGNPEKAKWIYAVSLTPLEKMKVTELLQRTTDETACPYNFEEVNEKVFKIKRKHVSTTQYFYDTSAPVEANANSRKKKRQRIEFDQSKCWFCLASPSVEKHLIVSIGDATYLALAKGGIVDEHFLICPIEHHQSSLTQPDEVTSETSKFKEALRKFYARKGEVPVFFERNYKTSHMQLQVIPIPEKATRELSVIFKEEAEGHGLKLDELDSNVRLDQVVQARSPFFTVELPDGTVLYTRIKGAFPLNFAREVLAIGPVLNMPARSDWRECILGKEEEERLVERIRREFEPFDFTNE